MRLHPFLIVSLVSVLASAAHGTEALRVVTFNVKDLGSNGSSQNAALKAVLSRIDADVCLLQEVDLFEAAQVPSFGFSIGYPYFRNSGTSGTMTGDLMVSVLSKHPILGSVSWNSKTISGDGTANDITRNILQVTIDVPDVCEPVALFTFHFKASGGATNDFRRAVENIRLKQVVEAYIGANPDHHIVFGGDFNVDPAFGPFGQTFNSLPSGLPATFDLGNDLSFPITYDPFTTVAGIAGKGFSFVPATHEDSTVVDSTFSSGSTIDFLWRSPLELAVLGDEVYTSIADNGVDDAPTGQWLYKSGGALSSSTLATASDHFPVYADFLLESCDGARFGFPSVGDHLLAARSGITGQGTVGDSTFGLKAVYAKPNTPCLLVLGQFKLAPPFGLSLNPYVPGAFLAVSPVASYGIFPATSDPTGRVAYPLPLPPVPGIAGFPLLSQWFVNDPAAPNGVGNVSDAYEFFVLP